MIDATKAALALLEEARSQRTAVLLVTDGKEEHSQYALSRLVTMRRQSEALIYALRPDPLAGAFSIQSVADYLSVLVGDSSGVIFPVYQTVVAGDAATSLLDDLRYS